MPRATYVAAGREYIVGVPARDLSAAEYRKYKRQIDATEKATGRRLYEVEAPDQATKGDS